MSESGHPAARAVQLFTPGIPQVYYVGLLAGRNVPDLDPAADSREINRRRYTTAQVTDALHRPVGRALAALIRFRNRHPAFGGEFGLPPADPGELAMAWRSGAEHVLLTARPAEGSYELRFTRDGTVHAVTDVAALPY